MELQTIRQVSLDYGISNRMLRYYEQIGLIESCRIDDYAYRVYDEANIKRLHQIIILRKLQIPMKQIKSILNNQDAIEVIEIFEQNINELDEQITALSTVKSILSRFVNELQEKADVHLKLDLLNDKTMLAVVNALSFSENKIKEKAPMEELSNASEHLAKEAEKNIRIVYRPPATMAYFRCDKPEIPFGEGRCRKYVEGLAKKFIEETNLFKIKPDMRVFVYGDDKDQGHLWVTIPDDMELPSHIRKYEYPGGLYAACREDFVAGEWVNKSVDYEWNDSQGRRAIGWEYFNPFNIYGLSGSESSYTEELFPIREIKKITDEEKEKVDAELKKIVPRSEPVNIDIMSMVLQNGDMLTPQQFSCPLKIELRAKKENDNSLGINFTQISFGLGSKTYLDIARGTAWEAFRKLGAVPIGEFVDIELILTKDIVAFKVNGELRYFSSDFEYIKNFKENTEYSLSGAIILWGATVTTVESLRVTEL